MDMALTKNRALMLMAVILLAAAFLRMRKLLDYPFFGDELKNGDIALEILQGNIAPFYPQAHGREALYNYPMAISFALLGDNVLANRLPSAAWSLVFVALMYRYGRFLFKSRRMGLLAAGMSAALWWPAVFAHLGLRAVAMPVTSVPALMGLVAGLQAKSEKQARAGGIMGGLFAGLTAYTYTSGRGFPAVVLLFLLYAALLHWRQLRQRWRVFAIYIVLMALVSAWLYVYLAQHPEYDERIGMIEEGVALFVRGDIGGISRAIRDTAGMFTFKGDSVWLYNITDRPVFAGPEGWLFYLGLLACIWYVRKPAYALQLIVIVVNMVPSLLTEHPPSWTRSIGILPGLLAVAVLPLELAWARLDRAARPSAAGVESARNRPMPLRLYAVLVAVLGVTIYWRTAHDMLEVWMNHPGVYWMTLAQYSETADYINQSPDTRPLDFNMEWYVPWRKTNLRRPVNRRDVELRWTIGDAFVFPEDPDGLRVAFQIYAAPALALQELFFDRERPLYIGPRVDPTGQHILRVYDIPRSRLDAHLAKAQQGDVFYPGGDSAVKAPVLVEDNLHFLGYEVVNPAARPGEQLNLLTYWQVLRPPPEMAVFLHLLDPQGQVVAQFDGFSVTVEDLQPGDRVVQLHALTLPPDLPDGEYRFQLGAYRRADLARMSLSIGSADDLLWLQTWRPPSE